MKNIIILYLISVYDNRKNLKEFIYEYKKFNPGVEHDLVICFKNFKSNDIIFKTPELKKIKFFKYIDNNNFNDYDWGSYYRIAEFYSNKIIFFMNCHSRPLIKNWLKLFKKNYSKNCLLGPGGSYESMVNSAIKGNHTNNIFKSIVYSFSNYLDFPIFPNPHLRSNCFMISAKNFLKLKLNNKYRFNKKGTWINESGRKGMTQQFKKMNLKIYIINSDGIKFKESEWKLSQTYALENQSKLIISDKFSKIYSKANSEEKLNIRKYVWN